MFIAGATAIVVTMLLALIRALLGPTVYDRILAVNTFGTATVLIIAFFGYMTGRPEWEDIALLYALVNFIGTIAVMKFFQHLSLGAPHGEDDHMSDF